MSSHNTSLFRDCRVIERMLEITGRFYSELRTSCLPYLEANLCPAHTQHILKTNSVYCLGNGRKRKNILRCSPIFQTVREKLRAQLFILSVFNSQRGEKTEPQSKGLDKDNRGPSRRNCFPQKDWRAQQKANS